MPISDKSACLTVRDLAGGYAGADHVVKGLSLEVAAGEILCIIGPNGAGKSTALKLIAGLLYQTGGDVLLADRSLTGIPAHLRARSGLMFVPQERNVFADLTVQENLEFGLRLDRKELKSRVEAILRRFPVLAERRRAQAGTLSGGQRQILAMAVALMARPQALLLDEPTAAVSPNMRAEIFTSIRSIAADGIAVLMVEQNAQEALGMSDRACVLVDGRPRVIGTAADIASDPEIKRVFLGAEHKEPTPSKEKEDQ